MADTMDIEKVFTKIGSSAADHGWDETRVGEMLDAGLTANRIASMYWGQRAADTTSLVDVSEGGSTRNLSAVHRHNASMAETYRNLAEEEGVVEPDAPVSGFRVHNISRPRRVPS